jgi:eukaryotic-like serine/threonine-protein kinase
MGPSQDERRPALRPTEDDIDVRARVPQPDEPATVPRAWLSEEGAIEIGSSMFIGEAEPLSPAWDGVAASLVGQLISGRYRVDAILGRGGLGAVYAGEQIHLRKRVAIKVLRPDTERLPGLVERFEREAFAGAHVQHPNVAAAFDFGKLDSGAYFLVSEYVEGVPLSRALAAGPLAPVRALRIARQMADALAAVHDKGILHRDIKPQNTILGEGDRVKIIDFGLAKVDIAATTGQAPAPGAVPLTGLNMVFGTIEYLAPEAELGMGFVDARSDLYALGVTLYEMLCGRRPFSAPDGASLFFKQRTEDPPRPQVRAPGVTVPAPAERVALRLVQRKPADRYASARETMDAIDEALRALDSPPPNPLMMATSPATPVMMGPSPKTPPMMGTLPTTAMAMGTLPFTAVTTGTSPPNPAAMGTSPPNPVAMGTSPPNPVTSGSSPSNPAEAPSASRLPATVIEKAAAVEAPKVPSASPGRRVPRIAIVIGALVLGGLVVAGLVVMLVRGLDFDDDDADPTPARTAAPAKSTTAPRPASPRRPSKGRPPPASPRSPWP